MDQEKLDRFAIVKKLGIQVGGKLAASILFVSGLLYLFEPILKRWLHQDFFEVVGRAQFFSMIWLLCILLWRMKRSNDMTAEIGRQITLANPDTPNTSEDPAINRALENGGDHPPAS